MTHSEALKLALDALGKFSIGYHVDAVQLNDLIATLEAALEQPEQEPVADLRCAFWLDPECADAGACQSLKFKAHPPRREWRSLSEEEIQTIVNKVATGTYQTSDTFARAIEAALKERNAS